MNIYEVLVFPLTLPELVLHLQTINNILHNMFHPSASTLRLKLITTLLRLSFCVLSIRSREKDGQLKRIHCISF